MTTAAAARVVVALSLLCGSYARADDRGGAATNPATPPQAGSRARDARARAAGDGAAQDPSKRPPPAVLVLPLIGLVLLPLTLPVAEPRGRQAAGNREVRPPEAARAGSAAPDSTTAITAAAAPRATTPEPAPIPGAERAPARAADACPACVDAPRTAADPGGAHP